MRSGTAPAVTRGALPDFIIIGGMKCGTTALHRYLGCHPAIATPQPKELNFFFGAQAGGAGNWWRGLDWYRSRFPVDAPVRGEASPGYTSPNHPGVAARMAQVVPDALVVYLLRDPLDRAVSQWLHHRRDGTEPRSVEESLLDPDSQYLARSRHHERLVPFLQSVAPDRLVLVDHADLLHRRRQTVQRLFALLGVDPGFWSPEFERRHNTAATAAPRLPAACEARFRAEVAADQERLHALLATHAGAMLSR